MTAKKRRAGGRGERRSGRAPTPPSPTPPGSDPRRARDAVAGAGSPESATGSIAAMAAIALALGFYFWTLGAPKPMENVELRAAGFDPFAGLPLALGLGIGAGVLAGILLSAWAPLRARRGAVALAAAGLYLAAGSPAIGKAALVLAPLAVAAELGWLEATKPRALSGSFLVALHAGAFVSALGFFHDWARYASGWGAFVKNAAALRALLL